MRSLWTGLLTAVAFLALAAPGAWADPSTDSQLQEMRDRMLQMEDSLHAATTQLERAQLRAERQEEMLERAGLSDGGTGNRLNDWLGGVSVDGWMASSWNWNFNNPDSGALATGNQGTVSAYPFHPDANSFSFDQLWLEIGREATEEHRAGFYVELAWAKTAGILSGNAGPDGLSGNDFDVYAAYVEYLAPINGGVNFKFGKFGTLIGWEVAQTPYNWNITRGNVYNLFQPITHDGILMSTDFGALSLTAGLVNQTRSFPAADFDLNNNKAVLWSAGYDLTTLGIEDIGFTFSGVWGESPVAGSNGGQKELILDWILSWDINEELDGYVNATYLKSDDGTVDVDPILLLPTADADAKGYGIATGLRYALNERTGISARYEYVTLRNFFSTTQNLNHLNSITGTVDHLLTDNLMVRGEFRWDGGDDGNGNNIFVDTDGPPSKASQSVVMVEAVYKFGGFAE